MKAFWKALGVAALAALVPVRYRKNEETGKQTFQSLLLSVDVDTDQEGKTVDIGVNLGEGVLTDLGRKLAGAVRESEMFTDDPAEAALDLEELQTVADDLQAAADEATADDFDPEF